MKKCFHAHIHHIALDDCRFNDKKRARLNVARDLLSKVDYEDKDQNSVCLLADPNIVHLYSQQSSFIKKNKDFKIFDKEKDKKDKKDSKDSKNDEKKVNLIYLKNAL